MWPAPFAYLTLHNWYGVWWTLTSTFNYSIMWWLTCGQASRLMRKGRGEPVTSIFKLHIPKLSHLNKKPSLLVGNLNTTSHSYVPSLKCIIVRLQNIKSKKSSEERCKPRIMCWNSELQSLSTCPVPSMPPRNSQIRPVDRLMNYK